MALAEYKNDMLRCTRCSSCKFIPLLSITKSKRFSYGCPAVSRHNFHSYSGSGKIICALSLLEGRIDYTDKLLHIIFNCTLCGACDLSCRIGTQIEVYEIIHELRVKCFEDGKAPLPDHRPILDSIRNYDNVWMQPRSRRWAWAKKLGIKDLNKEPAETLFYVGCTYCFEPRLREVVQKTAQLFQKAGVDFGILGDQEKCCGSPGYTIGDVKLFEEWARKNLEQFRSLGVKRVVTSCAGCYGMFKAHYPQLGEEMGFEVVHAIELIDQLIQEGKLKPEKPVPMSVTYHDPCHLGRLSEPKIPSHGKEEKILGTLVVKEQEKALGFHGVFDPPRNVLESIPGVELREMERVREYSWCCGSGAGVKSAFPEFALWTSQERLAEAISTGAEAMISCCPWCERNFLDGSIDLAKKELGDHAKDPALPIYDAVELLHKACF